MLDITEGLERIKAGIAAGKVHFSDKYSKLYHEAVGKHSAMLAAGNETDKASVATLQTAIDDAKTELGKHGELKDGIYVLKEGAEGEAITAFHEAEQKLQKSVNDLTSFRKGGKIGELEVASEELKKAFAEAETAANKVISPTTGRLGIVSTQKDGFAAALKHNGEKMKFWSENLEGMMPRAKAFAHGGIVVGSVIGIGDAILRSKDSEGEDRSAVARVAEAVIAGGVGTAALITGRAVAR